MGRKREWIRFALAAALGAVAAIAFDAGSTYRKHAERGAAGGARPQPSATGTLERAELRLLSPAVTSTSTPTDATSPRGRVELQLEQVNRKLATVQREKAQLEGEKRALESQLQALKDQAAAPPPPAAGLP
jgi:hypothetical protein